MMSPVRSFGIRLRSLQNPGAVPDGDTMCMHGDDRLELDELPPVGCFAKR
jgi:hypothetical protein